MSTSPVGVGRRYRGPNGPGDPAVALILMVAVMFLVLTLVYAAVVGGSAAP